ncbi:MAG: lipid II flippase MurJ, partial [Patescibacteria group bacterium]
LGSAWSGAITYYSLANNIQTMPSAVFANSIATALFPTIAQAAADRQTEAFKQHIMQGIRWILFLLIPASVGLIMLRIQVVRLILGAGFFGWESTQTTADVLGWFAISIVAAGLVPLLARAFYARQNTTTPMVISLVASVVTISLSFGLASWLPQTIELGNGYSLHIGEVAALAIAFSVGMIVNASLLLAALQRTVNLPLRSLLPSLGKVTIATVVMAVAVQLVKVFIGSRLNLDYASSVLIQTAAGLLTGTVVYILVVAFLRSSEWHELKKFLPRKSLSSATSTTLG